MVNNFLYNNVAVILEPTVFGRPFVQRFAIMLSDRWPICL